jgi:plastocyanin
MIPRRRGGATATLPVLAVLLATLALPVGAAAAPSFTVAGAADPPVAAALAPLFVNITATESLSFSPNSFTVAPGQVVHLVVTQGADFAHTFTLSSVVNATIPSSDTPSQVAAFFNAHPPIANLSLGSTAGAQVPFTFTAPTTLGAYEFVCLIHFPSMIGTMTVSTASPPGSGGTSPSPLEYVALGLVAAVVVIGAVVLAARRRRKSP